VLNIKKIYHMKIPQELDYLLKKQKRKDAAERIIRVYEALLYKKGNSKKWFDCPSKYLQKVHQKYNLVIPELIKYGIIEFKSINSECIYEDMFVPSKIRKKKYYYPTQSIKYRFLIDIENGYEYNYQPKTNLYDGEKWFMKTKLSLTEIGFSDDLIIKRDNFSRRLHTNITSSIDGNSSYKDILGDSIYYSIDSKTSHPRLLWLHLKEIGLEDKNFNYIFENGLDFYDYIIERIPVTQNIDKDIERKNAKDLFASWINGTGYLELDKVAIRNIFPVVNTFIRNYKTESYKNICRLLQHKEAVIFIDDLLNNCPVDFCLTIHDCLIVKEEDKDLVEKYCQSKYPNLIFKTSKINKRIK